LAQLAVHSDFPPSLRNYNVCFAFPVSHSLQYVYSGTSGIWNLPEFMIVRLVDGEPFVHYDSNSHKMTPLQEWMAKSEGPDYWNTESQVAMSDELAFENNIEVAKQRFNQTGGIHTLQVMYSCEWDDETGVSVYGYDGSDFLTLDLKTMTYVAPVMQAVPTKLNWNSGRAFLEGQKAYHTHICIEWLKKYVSYGKSTLERTVRPEVSLLQKDPSSPVTCHATGFFPKGIVVTWRKDGVDMHSDVEVGETLPNGNPVSIVCFRVFLHSVLPLGDTVHVQCHAPIVRSSRVPRPLVNLMWNPSVLQLFLIVVISPLYLVRVSVCFPSTVIDMLTY
uniref:Ig-like domain-containing protein n=1 Tax=Paramormyrops kingsleyae TaxID=1676925 RepID=A0A3B3QB97_9TELE